MASSSSKTLSTSFLMTGKEIEEYKGLTQPPPSFFPFNRKDVFTYQAYYAALEKMLENFASHLSPEISAQRERVLNQLKDWLNENVEFTDADGNILCISGGKPLAWKVNSFQKTLESESEVDIHTLELKIPNEFRFGLLSKINRKTLFELHYATQEERNKGFQVIGNTLTQLGLTFYAFRGTSTANYITICILNELHLEQLVIDFKANEEAALVMKKLLCPPLLPDHVDLVADYLKPKNLLPKSFFERDHIGKDDSDLTKTCSARFLARRR